VSHLPEPSQSDPFCGFWKTLEARDPHSIATRANRRILGSWERIEPEVEQAGESIMVKSGRTKCHEVGRLIAKDGCYALHSVTGTDVWLEIEPVPLHLIDEDVEIIGERFGKDLIWVSAIGPARRVS
jgi:hypothetical protein